MHELRPYITGVNMAVSVVMYAPLFQRILRRKDTRSFSVITQTCIVGLQVSTLFLAGLERAWFLSMYYVLQIALTGTLLWLVVKYRGG